MQIPFPAIVLMQRTADSLLTKSPDSHEILLALDGAVVEIEVRGLGSLFLLFRDAGVEIARQFDGRTDTTLSGTPLALASLTKNNSALFKGEVTMKGDVATGKRIKSLLESIEFDPEEELSHFVGDAFAHKTAHVHKTLFGWLARTVENTGLNTSDYLTEEVHLTPPQLELEHFCDDVAELRGDVDRLEARIDQLTQSGKVP